MRLIIVLSALLISSLLFVSHAAASPSGELHANLAALKQTSPGSSQERALQKKIIDLIRKMKNKPFLTDAVERHMARGEGFVESAKSKGSFERAAREFRAVTRLAPWIAQGYYNLGVVQEKAGRYDAAMASFRMYIFAMPQSFDPQKVKRLIYKIEARKEEAKAQAGAQAAERRRQEQARLRRERERRGLEDKKRRDRGQAKILDALKFGNWCEFVYRSCHTSISVSIKVSGGDQIKIRANSRGGSYRLYDGRLSGNTLSGSFLQWVCCNRRGEGQKLQGTFKGEIDSSGRTIKVRSRYVWNGKVNRNESTFSKR